MSIQREGRRIRLPETRTSWEDKGTSEVAAGKLEVMEKFFTPLPHSSSQRPSKSSSKGKSSWEGTRNHYYKESMSSSSASSSSSPWSSESNFRVHGQFQGYNSRAPHSRSCNDISLGKGRGNEDKRNFVSKQDALHAKKASQQEIDHLSPVRSRTGSAKKSHSGDSKETCPNNKSGREDKKGLKNGGRRAKSMEALVEKEARKKEGKGKKRVTIEKQRFSRFLDEITVQVLSPSNLNSLGIKERQNLGNRDQWKNSSTDSLGSRGKRSQHNSVAEHQEGRKKGKGKTGSATKAKVSADPPEPWRRRDKSTSPDSVTSSTRHRCDREDANLSSSNTGHQPRRTSRRLSQENVGKPLDHKERDKKDGLGGAPKGKAQYNDKAQNSNLTLESATKAPIIPPPAWWGDSGNPAASQHSDKTTENHADQSRRIKDKFPGTQPSNQSQEANLNSSTLGENLEQDKDFLNQKITELLDHLVRAQSTICALEKLNVASLLRYLPADVLDSVKVPHQGPDGSIQTEGIKCPSSSHAITSQMSNLAISSGNMKNTGEENTDESQSAPRVTAFSPWSPRRQKSISALHTLYTSTESECSLEDTPPTCKLLSPRFPKLGESFSDDRKDDHSTDGCDSRTEQKHTGASKSPLPTPSLLPAHRTPQHNHHSRTSSTESSGEDPIMSWTDAPSYEPPLDYNSAQKILDTLLGLKNSATNIAKPEIAGGFSSVDALKIDGRLIRSENKYLENPKSVAPRTDTKHMSYSGVNKDCLNISGKCSPNDSILCNTHSPLPSPVSGDSKLPPLPAKRTLVPESFGNTCPALSPVGEVGFRPVGKNEGLMHHKSDFLMPTCYLSSSMQSTDPLIQHPDSFMLRSPSGTELAMGNWETSQNSHQQEGQRGRKSRKDRTVTFSTINNDGQSKQSLVTVRSKFMSSKMADQGQEDNTSMDSTLL
ncbi:uncharacterized protein LOC143935467 isoform X1 [Lithobates pipiens]